MMRQRSLTALLLVLAAVGAGTARAEAPDLAALANDLAAEAVAEDPDAAPDVGTPIPDMGMSSEAVEVAPSVGAGRVVVDDLAAMPQQPDEALPPAGSSGPSERWDFPISATDLAARARTAQERIGAVDGIGPGSVAAVCDFLAGLIKTGNGAAEAELPPSCAAARTGG